MADTSTANKNTVFDKVGDWFAGIGKLFNVGTEVFVAGSQRVKALEDIGKDTIPTTTTTAAPAAAITPARPAWVMPAIAVGLVILGIIVARKMR